MFPLESAIGSKETGFLTVFSVWLSSVWRSFFSFTSFIPLWPSFSCLYSQDLSCSCLLPEEESWELIGILHGSRGKRPTDTSWFLKLLLVLLESCFILRSVPSRFLTLTTLANVIVLIWLCPLRKAGTMLLTLLGSQRTPAFFHSTIQAHFFLSSCSSRPHYKNWMERHFLPPPL